VFSLIREKEVVSKREGEGGEGLRPHSQKKKRWSMAQSDRLGLGKRGGGRGVWGGEGDYEGEGGKAGKGGFQHQRGRRH